MEILLKILGVPISEIARRTNVSRQAAWKSLRKGTGAPCVEALRAIEESRRDPAKIARALEARKVLEEFLEGPPAPPG